MLMRKFFINGLDNKFIEIANNLNKFTRGEGNIGMPIARRIILVLVGLMFAQLVQIYLKHNEKATKKLNDCKIPEIIIISSILTALSKLI